MKILIAEDDEDSRAMLTSILTGYGYEVISCGNGIEALRLARTNQPNLIISDILMPEMDGFELCCQTKADAELKNIPFIFYTATYTDHCDEELAMAISASRFLVKPLEPQTLIGIIQEIMAASRTEKLPVPQKSIKEISELKEMHLHSVSRKLDKKTKMLEREREVLKKNEERLKKLTKQLSKAQEIAHLGSWELDPVSDEPDCSDEMYRIFEFAPKAFSQSTRPFYKVFVDTIHPDDRKYVFNAYTAFVRNRRPYNIEYRLLMKDGRIKYIYECRETAYDGEGSGKVLRSHGIVLDITERKQSEIEREKLQEQLVKTQKMESVGRVASGVVHDFNNMISVILGFADLALVKMGSSNPFSTDMKEIRKAAVRSANLTRQLMTFLRKQKTVPRVLALNKIVEDMINMLRRLAGSKIDLAWQPDTELGQIKIDPVQIDQIMTNLCANARDAIAGKGNIKVETRNIDFDESYCAEHPEFVAGKFVRLCVIDDGCGMDKNTKKSLFEPFFTTKGEGQGIGLGLSTVYGVVKQNNGFISVDSEPGEGTTFNIYLPRYTD